MSSAPGGQGPVATITIGQPSFGPSQVIQQAVAALLAASPGESLHTYTPKGFLPPSAGHPIVGNVNIETGTPKFAGQSVTLAPKAQGIVLTGVTAARITGHAANQYGPLELLAGNGGNDTIIGGGGSGTIVSGTGENRIRTGPGSMDVYSFGSDRISTGAGFHDVEAFANATVQGGSGLLTFTDSSSNPDPPCTVAFAKASTSWNPAPVEILSEPKLYTSMLPGPVLMRFSPVPDTMVPLPPPPMIVSLPPLPASSSSGPYWLAAWPVIRAAVTPVRTMPCAFGASVTDCPANFGVPVSMLTLPTIG